MAEKISGSPRAAQKDQDHGQPQQAAGEGPAGADSPREGEQGGPGGGEPPQPEQPPGVHGQYSFRSATWQETRKETASPARAARGTRANPAAAWLG